MKGRDRNPAFFNNQKPKQTASLQSKFKAARAQGTLNMSSGTPPLTTIPLEIFDLEKCIEDGEKFWEFEPLKSLDLSFNKITVIPGEICSLVDCVSMKFRDNLIQELPEGLFEGCISVKHLDLGMNKVTALSARVCNLTYLKDLLMPHNNLTSLPDTLFECRSIVNLDVEHNKLRALPQRWAMAALVTLNVANNTLAALPPCLAEVLSLEVLNCGSNSIAQLPDLSRLVNLKYLDASQNVLEAFPRLPRENSRNQLSHLLLGYNRISSIDIDALTHHKALSELLLHNNRLQEVPGEIEYIASLKIIDVANNDLRDLPPTLGYMPNLQHIRAEGNPIRVIRQQVLLKPVNELKAHLRGRGPSLLEAALIQDGAELQRLASAAQQQQEYQQHSPGAAPFPSSAASGTCRAGSGAAQRKAPNNATLAAATAQVSNQVHFRIRDITGTTLDMSALGLLALPSDFVDSVMSVPLGPTVVTLNLANNSLSTLPVVLNYLLSIRSLVMSDNKLGRITGTLVTVCDIPHITSIDVSKNEISAHMFQELLCPVAPPKLCNLNEIVANNNPLRMVPAEIVNHRGLRTIRLSYCQLSAIDIDFTLLPSLVTLDVSNNKIADVDTSLFRARLLEYISVENNELHDIPAELAALPRIKVLLIAGNPQRTVRTNVLAQGSSKVIEFLRSRLAPSALPASAATAPSHVEGQHTAPAVGTSSSRQVPSASTYDRRDIRDDRYSALIPPQPAPQQVPQQQFPTSARRTSGTPSQGRYDGGFQATDEPFDFSSDARAPPAASVGADRYNYSYSDARGDSGSTYAGVKAEMQHHADSSVFRNYDQSGVSGFRDPCSGQLASYRQAVPPGTSSRGDSRGAVTSRDSAYSLPAPRYGRGGAQQQAGASSVGSLLNPSAGGEDAAARRASALQSANQRRGNHPF